MTTQPLTALAEARHIIGGEHRHIELAQTTTICDAPDGSPAFTVAQATAGDVDDAVATAVAGFAMWKRTPLPQRTAILRRAAVEIAYDIDVLAPIIVSETGKPIAQARGEVTRASQALCDAADSASTLAGRVLHDQSTAVWGMELLEPRGPSAVINAWNMPVQLAAIKVGAALAAGCSVVLKPSPYAPMSCTFLHSALIRAGLPEACLSILHGDAETVTSLARHPDLKVLSLTGSNLTGREVMSSAASTIKKLVLELGGKSANIVLADADVQSAVRGILAGFIRNQGAACTAATRILVDTRIYEEVLGRLTTALKRVTVGDPYTEVQVGALRGHHVLSRLQDCLSGAIDRGAEVIGGETIAVPGRTGCYMRPAIVLGLTNEDDVAQTELFGPVAALIPVDGVDEALRLANASRYGIAAGVWSSDLLTLQHVWSELDVGTVFINSYNRIDGIPLAAEGRSDSGFGAENGTSGLYEFLCRKSVHFPSRIF